MALLFGWHDPALDPAEAAALLDRVERDALFPLPRSSAREGSGLCATWGGDTRREADGLLAALIGHPQWKNPELAQLAADLGHAAALAAAYRRHGADLVRELAGAFVLALIDPAQQRTLLALDRIGQRHLFYARTATGLVFGTHADAVRAHPGVSGEIDPQAVFDYVYSHHCPSPGSIYKHLRKLDGAELLLFQAGEIQVRRYWQPEFSETAAPLAELAQALREGLFGAVARLGADGRKLGAFLSGGLDSSTVAGALARARPGAAPTFSMGFPIEGYDEMAYARIAAAHFKTQAHEYYLSPDDAVAAIPQIAAAYDEPFGNSSALPTYFCAKLAKAHGMNLLLGGDGGDELFAGNTRYATQRLFQPYLALPGAVRGGIETAFRALPESLAGTFPLRKLVRYLEQAKTPLPDRLHDYNFLHRIKLDAVFAADFLAQVDGDAPLEIQRASYQRPASASALNRMLYLDWKTTLHDNDLVKVNQMCELAGVAVAYPMLDDAVVELSCRVPSAMKLKLGQLRWFYKQAMADFLPPAILAKSKHGFGLPFGVWLKEHPPLRELAYDNVLKLKDRPYFRPSFLDEAIQMHQSGHAGYYGELIWILMMLELWFSAKAGGSGL
ncbi:asparagine synthase (glutamine-hydrolysing) [Methylomagnum ishizawai]|uniref:asparagine synthase (glutamine-hydrolyzing) n=1 Tax=Methylomagnum ishizawai TaxID=1760988 RepID=A0A1Y6D4J5_9GAMM|nr:asparagine synthase-related protein [Methylomagnum ishizawai]SMF94885.1 asparagine synthase (glutamine-hydrolysing) [Methylomagnum ishizawai]